MGRLGYDTAVDLSKIYVKVVHLGRSTCKIVILGAKNSIESSKAIHRSTNFVFLTCIRHDTQGRSCNLGIACSTHIPHM